MKRRPFLKGILTATLAIATASCAFGTDPDREEPWDQAQPPAAGPGDSEAAGDGADQEAQPPQADAEPELADAPNPYGPVVLSEQEVYPEAKRLASEVAQSLTTYEVDGALADVVIELAGEDRTEELAEAAAELHHEGSWSRGRVVYPQLGGVTDDRVSVMVVTEQRIGDAEGERTETRTLDVRLRMQEGAWVFDELASVGGVPVEGPEQLPPAAQDVLEHPDIELPDSARWDILSGDISVDLLELMARAADQTPYGVVVLSTGHPWEIFGTERQSDHTRGKAVDIYRVGDESVIDDRHEGSATRGLVEWFYSQPEVSRVGSPWALDGFGGRSFTDVVHQDHLHVSVAD